MKRCIQRYELASGQVVNYEKFAITFCPSSSTEVINNIIGMLGIPFVKGYDLYLGLLKFSLRSKRVQFSSLRDRVYNRINVGILRCFL